MPKKSFFFSTKVGWREATKTVGLSLLLAFGIRSFVAEARFIPSGSMEPTLQVHDRLIIDKVTYQFNSPQRGDIIVFHPPQSLQQQVDQQDDPLPMDTIIKRVIGVPGDQSNTSGKTGGLNWDPLKGIWATPETSSIAQAFAPLAPDV